MKDDTVASIFGCAMLGVCCIITGGILGGMNAADNFRDKAIKAGVAQYYIEGKDVKFRFKTNAPPQFLPSAYWSIVSNRWSDSITNYTPVHNDIHILKP